MYDEKIIEKLGDTFWFCTVSSNLSVSNELLAKNPLNPNFYRYANGLIQVPINMVTEIQQVFIRDPDDKVKVEPWKGNHVIYTISDFTEEQADRESPKYIEVANQVVHGGLSVCKFCGEYESGLDDNPCKGPK